MLVNLCPGNTQEAKDTLKDTALLSILYARHSGLPCVSSDIVTGQCIPAETPDPVLWGA